ncbi:MAG: septum formation initiator family protein [Silicimonas sp.]|nr:septum formation initiator family protein [Silicimonas sp.]NNF91540.1 septum formation initiator family protein [Boseongicola sp.]RZW06202.1 MAG: septum formation initiator family protein [Paracoccaceae bacterium]NND22004.1 septum formation initiator family protein [Silicimonas sp.]NND40695.1 septum formation initiator family protein [Silicimonas sp.]
MTSTLKRPGLGVVAYFALMFSLGIYFMFASVQGDFGLFRRVQIEAEATTLADERDRLAAEVSALENKTHRLSDTYLDLDLLDSQARDVLGLIRSDEIVLN